MKAARISCFYPTQAVALAMSLSFMCGPVVLANPDGGKSATAPAAVKQDNAEAAGKGANSAGKGSTASGKDATDSSKDVTASKDGDEEAGANPDAKDLKAIETSDTAKDKKVVSGTAVGGAVAKAKDDSPTEEQLHESGYFHWNLAKKYSKDGDLDLAQTELELAIMNWPDMKIAHRDLCLLSLVRLNFMRSIAEFMMTVGLGEAVPMNEAESSKLMEDSMTMHYKKGLGYARAQNWDKTTSELELAVHLIPDDFAVQRALAFAYASEGKWAKAEEHYKATFDLSPHDGSSRADLAYFLARSGKVGEAQKEMEEAVKSQPKAAAYHVDLSCMAETRGDLDTASKELQEALNLVPHHADLWAHLGRVLERKGEKTQAVDAYTKALAIDPSLIDAKQSIAKLQNSNDSNDSTPQDESLKAARVTHT